MPKQKRPSTARRGSVLRIVGHRHGEKDTEQEVMDNLEFIARVTSQFPDKGQVMDRYYGLCAKFDPSDEPFLKKKSMGLTGCFVASEEPVATGRNSARPELRLIWTDTREKQS